MGFSHDTLASGRMIRTIPVVDVCSREWVAFVTARQFRATDAAARLRAAGDARGGLPPVVQCDNGTEFTCTALNHWAYWNPVQLDYSRPRKSVDDFACETFHRMTVQLEAKPGKRYAPQSLRRAIPQEVIPELHAAVAHPATRAFPLPVTV